MTPLQRAQRKYATASDYLWLVRRHRQSSMIALAEQDVLDALDQLWGAQELERMAAEQWPTPTVWRHVSDYLAGKSKILEEAAAERGWSVLTFKLD